MSNRGLTILSSVQLCIFRLTAMCAVAGMPTYADAEVDAICASVVKKGPGLYVNYPGSHEGVPINGRIQYDANARIYIVPWFGPRAVSENKEAVWHVRSRTTAGSDIKSNQAYVYRAPVRTRCRDGRIVDQSQGQQFQDFDQNERFVSLNRYIDHHAKNLNEQRRDFGLTTYFHFEVSRGDIDKCFQTDDPNAVGNLDDAYGFPDVPRTSGFIARHTSPVDPAIAAQSNKYAGLSSELAYQFGPAPACFSVRAPVPTASTFFSEIFTWRRNDAALSQIEIWNPVQTEIVVHAVPNPDGVTGKRYIDWKP
jgi:hypothetical protein